MAKAEFNKKKALFTNKLDLNLRMKLVKCYIWNVALYGPETWTLRKVGQKYTERFEMWCWRRIEKIIWTDLVTSEALLMEARRRGISYVQEIEGRLTGVVTF
jgi:hypothetical protein